MRNNMFRKLSCIKRQISEDDIDAQLSNDEKKAPPTRRVMNLLKTVKHPIGRKLSHATNETRYRNDHSNIGVALVFNHKKVPGHPVRSGTEKDKIRVETILRKYGFDVRAYDDLTYDQIAEKLIEVSNEDHSDNDCLFVLVMSHGIPGHIYASDRAYLSSDLWTPFLGENCKSLINKPKLFFIQACRGDKADAGAVFRTDSRSLVKSDSFDEVDSPMTYTIPSTADTLLFYSTWDGFVSFRNKTDGSWFIQTVSLLLEQYFRDDEEVDLYHFVTAVNRKVAYEYQSHAQQVNYNDMKAMPNFISTLTKIFIFKAKPK